MLKLGSQTGSMMNHLYSRATKGQPDPVVGMGVTFLMWSDRSAGTIQKVYDVKGVTFIECSRDRQTMVGGHIMSEDQQYTFETVDQGARVIFKREASGSWTQMRYKEVGYDEVTDRSIFSTRLSKVSGGCGLRIGERDHYRDPSF